MTEKEAALKRLMERLSARTGETEPDVPVPVNLPAPKTPNPVIGAPPDVIPVPQYQQLIPDVPAETLPVPVVPETPAPTPAPVSNLPVPIAAGRRTSADVQNDINATLGKDYSFSRDADGKEIRGKDRSRNWTTAQKILSSIAGAGMGLLQGGVGGAIVGGILGGTNRNFFAQQKDNRNLARYIPEQQRLQKQEDFQSQQALRNTQIQAIKDKPLEADKEFKREVFKEEQEQQNRIALKMKEEEIAGRKVVGVETTNGKKFLRYGDGSQKPLINPLTGEQEIQFDETTFDTGRRINGQPIYSTGKEETRLQASQNEAQARLNAGTNETNSKLQADYEEADRKYKSEETRLDTEITTIAADIDRLDNRVIAIQKEIEAASLLGTDGEAEIKRLTAERDRALADKQSRSKDYSKTLADKKALSPPVKPQLLTAPNVTGGALKGKRVSLDDARKLAKSKGKNLSDDELRRQIESQGGVAY